MCVGREGVDIYIYIFFGGGGEGNYRLDYGECSERGSVSVRARPRELNMTLPSFTMLTFFQLLPLYILVMSLLTPFNFIFDMIGVVESFENSHL